MTDAPRPDAGSGPAQPAAGPAATVAEPPASGSDTGAPAAAGARRGRRGYFLPGAIALAALLLIGGAVGAGDLAHPAPEHLRGSDVASQIALGVQEQRNSATLPKVTCPATEPVRRGYQFDCTLDAGAAPATVTVTEFNGRGGLHWSLSPTRPPQ